MATGGSSTVQPIDSFSITLKVLTWAGFSQLRNPKSTIQKVCHNSYRYLAIVIVVLYNLQHILFIIQNRNDSDKVIEGIMMEVPEMNLILKVMSMWKTSKLIKIYDILQDPMFAAVTAKDEELLIAHTRAMHRLAKVTFGGLMFVLLFWVLSPISKRMQDETYVLPLFMPFETNTWPRYGLSIFFQSGPMLWIAYGHLAIDIVIVTFYAQSIVQLKIIKQNLEHVFDKGHVENRGVDEHQYLDVIDSTLRNRFIYYVKRYETIVRYTKLVNVVFDNAISFQFLVTTAALCLVIYLMSTSEGFTVQFIFYIGYYVVIQAQGFLFCFYGGQIMYESSFVSDSAYLSDWLSLSPRFRRSLLIAMTRWRTPIAPKVSKILPLTITTIIWVTRSSYTLYTVLKSRNSNKMT